MRVLRSRVVKSQSPPLQAEISEKMPEFIEPETRMKAAEIPPNTTSGNDYAPLSVSSRSTGGSGSVVVRRSSRLASKGIVCPDLFVSSRKRKSSSVGIENERKVEDALDLSCLEKKGGKRKLGVEFDLVGEGEGEGCLRLRSGKKVVTASRVETGGFGGEELVSESGKVGEVVEVSLSGDGEFDEVEDAGREMVVDGKWSLVENGEDDNGVEGGGEALGRELEEMGTVVGIDLLLSGFDARVLDSSKVGESDELENGVEFDTSGSYNVKGEKRLSREEKGKWKVRENGLSSGFVKASELDLSEVEALKELENKLSVDRHDNGNNGRTRPSREYKGKAKIGENVVRVYLTEVENSTNNNVSVPQEDEVLENERRNNVTRVRERFRNIARKNASRFAKYFPSNEAEEFVDVVERSVPPREVNIENEDWPGPFSTAMKIIRDREINGNVHQKSSSLDKSKSAPVTWIPKKDQNLNGLKVLVPSLKELCLTILTKHVDAITSLDCVPDVLRHKLTHKLCDTRRMNNHFLGLLVQGSPTEIRVRDCSWLAEEHFTSTFEGADINKLSVLQLDHCGRCLPDYILHATLARLPNILPVLTTISLKGAYRLSDVGLSSLLSSAPALRSINLSQCSLLTFAGISSIADSLGSVLRELYLDDCQGIDAVLALPALSKLEHLEVLSLAGLQTVCDDFISQFVSEHAHKLKELVLADCVNLTDYSVKVISEICCGLCAIDLTNLCHLTDFAIAYLANGCQSIKSFKLRGNAFSDEAIAAYLETCGESLEELSLNNVTKVACNTAISLSKRSKNLQILDLSWCRNMTNEAVGLIVDSCLSLTMLKLFGCTQITNVFLDGHSNAQVQVVGLKMTPILEHIKVPDLQGPLNYSSVSSQM